MSNRILVLLIVMLTLCLVVVVSAQSPAGQAVTPQQVPAELITQQIGVLTARSAYQAGPNGVWTMSRLEFSWDGETWGPLPVDEVTLKKATTDDYWIREMVGGLTVEIRKIQP